MAVLPGGMRTIVETRLTRLSVAPLRYDEDVRDVAATEPRPYAALIASCGYETRGRAVAEMLAARCANVVAYTFQAHRVLAYKKNREYFEGVGEVFDEPDAVYRKHLGEQLLRLRERLQEATILLHHDPKNVISPLRIAVDISSMDRERLARTLLALTTDHDCALEVDFFYAVAQFSKAVGHEGTVRVNRPVEGFEGWASDPALPAVCVVGAGFEGDLILGALEQLEPAETVAFVPFGEDERYDSVLRRNNATLFDDRLVRFVPYEVGFPHQTYSHLDGLVHRLVQNHRVIIIPLGPKIFALAGMLVSLSEPNVTVWRLSADDGREPTDRRASGKITGLRVRIPARTA